MSGKAKHGKSRNGPRARGSGDKKPLLTLNSVVVDPDDLKAHFKRAGRSVDNDNWAIRIHRSISWYRRAMNMARSPEMVHELEDAEFIFLWIALSALFGTWDANDRRPAQEGQAMRDFLVMLEELDQGHVLPDCVGQILPTANRLRGHQYLCPDFWRNPFDPSLSRQLEAYKSPGKGKPFGRKEGYRILHDTLLRIYTLRGQVVHGSSTSGGRLNRKMIRDALRFLERVMPAILNVVIEYGALVEWPALCYPPVDPSDKKSLEALTTQG